MSVHGLKLDYSVPPGFMINNSLAVNFKQLWNLI